MRKILQLNKDTKLTAVREAAKHTVIRQTRKSRGLAPAGEPTGAMLDKSLYFNWRGQGKEHRAPVNMDWFVELLLGCLKLDNELFSEAYGAFLSMMQIQGFETGMERLRYCMPALASELGSDPEHTIATRCLNNIPDHLKNTAQARQRMT